MSQGSADIDTTGSHRFELHTPSLNHNRSSALKGQAREVLFVFIETPSLALNSLLTRGGINYHVSDWNLTQELKEGHNLSGDWGCV